MGSAADLNARADAVAGLYDTVALLTSEALGGANVASGGTAQTVTYHAGGAEGPVASDHPAIDGLAWSGVNSFTLAEVATHVGLVVGSTVVRTVELPVPLGPGVVPFVHGVGPAGL